uniref:RiboL-PSP-HEPN domain-containing protein n=1 Tax=Streptomyces sp. NBC_00008 TaxID=2903610 RepID=A0AAU2VSU0_9ACTN
MGGTELTTWQLTESGESVLRRVSPLGAAPYDASDHDAIQAAVVSCATLVEAHVDRVIKCLFAADDAMTFPLARVLHAEIEDSIFRTWDARRKWLASAFGINISGDRENQQFDAVIGLRNSIVHGDGSLTDLQIGNVKDLFRWKEQFARVLSAKVSGRRITLTPEVAVKAAIISRDFVLHFDRILLATFPTLTVLAS